MNLENRYVVHRNHDVLIIELRYPPSL